MQSAAVPAVATVTPASGARPQVREHAARRGAPADRIVENRRELDPTMAA